MNDHPIEITPAMVQAAEPALKRTIKESGYRAATVATLRAGLDQLAANGGHVARREGYEQAIAALAGVAQRTGSPAARWAADYLAADPDRSAPGTTRPDHSEGTQAPNPTGVR